MTSQPTRTSTDNRQEETARYEKASTIECAQAMSTSGTTENVRTVTTNLTEGNLEIRYTPRNVVAPSGETRI